VRVLVFGRRGQLGRALERAIEADVVGPGREEVDLRDADALRHAVHDAGPDVVVNAAAYTAVDRAESEEEEAARVNAVAPGVIAEAAQARGAACVHFSTDYVFDGAKRTPYVETDEARPLCAYGRTKLAGEAAALASGALVLRTGWLWSLEKPGFVTRVLADVRAGRTVRAVVDQVGGPTSCDALAAAVATIVARGAGAIRERWGLLHASSGGAVSRFEWAKALAAGAVPVEEARTEEFGSAARRPAYSVLDCAKLADVFGVRLPAWDAR